MKSKIETTTPQPQEIDWGKPMLVKCTEESTVILTSGIHDGALFYGTIICSDTRPVGNSKMPYYKGAFQPLPLPQTITFYE